MDKAQRKRLKKTYLKEQRKTDLAFQFLEARKEQIQQVGEIDAASMERWTDDVLAQKLLYYVLNQFDQAGKPPRHVNLQQWERSMLLQLPVGVQAVFATYLFESSFSLNASFWDFFYQNNGAFALETLNGYKLMNNQEMATIVEQGMGAYLKMHYAGAIAEMTGEPHQWAVDENHCVAINRKSFEELDAAYEGNRQSLLEALRAQKVSFIRKNPELFVTKK